MVDRGIIVSFEKQMVPLLHLSVIESLGGSAINWEHPQLC